MKFLPALIVSAFIVTSSLVACGDDSSSVFPDAVGDLPSSSAKSDDAPASSGDNSSGSSVMSSFSAKSSSSTDAKSSSSVTPESSSEEFFVECDTEGQISYMLVDRVRTRFICENGRLVEFPESSSSVKSSSSYFNMSKQYNEKRTYGTFVDPRDNQEYRTITVEKEAYNLTLVVFATNLNYGKMVTAEAATYSDEIVEKFCYNDDPWYCENGFGGLYTWSEAMGLPRACDTVALGSTPECPDTILNADKAQRQGVCPDGWHVMNGYEWRKMPTSEGKGAYPMLSQVFGGDDDIGLAVLLGGMSNPDLIEKNYYRIGTDGFYWVAEEIDSLRVGVVSFTKTNVKFSDTMGKPSVLSVRCVKDY